MGPETRSLKNLEVDNPIRTASSTLPSPEICVICLDRISEKAIALPCGHDHFDFLCLGTWLQQRHVCPLCKATVKAVQYDVDELGQSKTFHLPGTDLPRRTPLEIEQRRRRHRSTRDSIEVSASSAASLHRDQTLLVRRCVYDRKLYSLRVGTNRISKYRNVTHLSFLQDADISSRAEKWIRRELAVFDFLDPDSPSFGSTERRASNTEFLLQYIMAVLRSLDIRGSSGQAEELLKDFLGRDNARLFLHELEAWLRSPYDKLEDWDKTVQYKEDPTQESDKHLQEFQTDSAY